MEIINQHWELLSLIVPFIVAFGSKYTSRGRVKLALTLSVTIVLTAVSVLGMDWADVGPNELVSRLVTIFGGAQLTYHAVNEVMKQLAGSEFNSKFAPEKGIG